MPSGSQRLVVGRLHETAGIDTFADVVLVVSRVDVVGDYVFHLRRQSEASPRGTCGSRRGIDCRPCGRLPWTWRGSCQRLRFHRTSFSIMCLKNFKVRVAVARASESRSDFVPSATVSGWRLHRRARSTERRQLFCPRATQSHAVPTSAGECHSQPGPNAFEQGRECCVPKGRHPSPSGSPARKGKRI